MTCPSINNIKTEFLNKLKKELKKVCQDEYMQEQIQQILKDIESYIYQVSDYEQLAMQSIIGMKALFQGQIVKNLVKVNDYQNHMI